MVLNRSTEQTAQELDLDPDDAQRMATRLRVGIVPRSPAVVPSGEVACDEVDAVAGHRGPPEAVRRKGGRADADAGGANRAGGPGQSPRSGPARVSSAGTSVAV